jgi:hypothetical protein
MPAQHERNDRRVADHNLTPIGTATSSTLDARGLTFNWTADTDALREYMTAILGTTQPLSRWQRILVWFGLARKPVPYTHTFMPIVIGPTVRFDEMWGDWEWADPLRVPDSFQRAHHVATGTVWA